jgi:hypothetical protein
MSTNSRIGILNEDKSIDMIYCHFDGYPDHHAPILLNHYNSEEKAKELIALGDISVLADSINPTSDTHSFKTPENNVVIAYGRDRHEPWYQVKPKHYLDKSEMLRDCQGMYVYLFNICEGKWTYTTNLRFKDLSKCKY